MIAAHPETGVNLTYVQQSGDTLTSSDGGDQYTGFDRFGRIIDQNYLNGSGTSVERFQYGYDRDGNVLYKNNLIDPTQSELYHASSTTTGDNASEYDPLNRLTSFAVGTLSSSGNNGSSLDTIASASHTQGWSLDQLGNWTSSTTNSTTTSRTTDDQNRLTGVGSSSLTYDNNGNMLTDESSDTYTYDAWNRMVNGNCAYDALGRRITEFDPADPVYGGTRISTTPPPGRWCRKT